MAMQQPITPTTRAQAWQMYQEQQRTTPPATITQLPHPVSRLLDLLSRPVYAVSSAALAGVRGEPIGEAFMRGLRGEQPASFRDVAIELGVPETPIIPAFEGIPVLGSTWAGAAGLAGDILFDPLSYVGIGTLNRAGRMAQQAQKLHGLRSAQALAGQRDLITISGIGPSSLPGAAGEAARQATAAVYRGQERLAQALQRTRLGESLTRHVTTRGTGPVAVVRERLRQREAEEAYLTRQASREYGIQRRRITEIANQYGLDPEELRRQIVQAAETLPRADDPLFRSLPPEAQEIVQQIRAAQPERLGRELAAGVQTPEFQSERIAYIHRLASDELRALPRRNRELTDWLQGNRPILSLRHGAQRARSIDPDAYIREINQAAVEGRTKAVWVDAEGNIVPEGTRGATKQYVITDEPQKNPALPRVPIFSEDPSVIELARERMTIRSTTSARAIDDIINLGLSEGWAVRATSEEFAQELLSRGWKSIQAPRFGDKLKDVYFPPEVAKEIDKFVELFTNRQVRDATAEAIRNILGWWRDQTLFVFPEYHVRNLGTGIVKNYYAGLLPSDAKSYLQGQLFSLLRQADMLSPRVGMAENVANAINQLKAAKIKTKDGKTYTLQQVLDWYEAERLGQGFFTAQFPGAGPSASEMLTVRFDPRRLNPLRRDSYYVRLGQAAGTYIEDNLRGALFIKKLKEGYSPHDAANAVRQYHFDYSDIPEWMKVSRDYATPFITWAYKNLPNEIATLVQQPGKISRITSTVRAAEAGAEGPPPAPEEVPSFLLFPVYMGRDEEGNARFANLLNAWGLLDLADIADDPLGFSINQLHGYIQALWGLGTNIDPFTRRPIVPEEMERAREQIVRYGDPTLGERIAMYWGSMAPTEPFGLPARLENLLETFRPYTTVSRFFDPRTTVPEAALRTLTSYAEYTSDPYFSWIAPVRTAQDAQSYVRNQIIRYEREAYEAELRGDARAALLNRQMAERWRQIAQQYLEPIYESIPIPQTFPGQQ